MDVFYHLPKDPVFLRLLLLLAMSKSNNAMFRTLACCQLFLLHNYLRARKASQNDI